MMDLQSTPIMFKGTRPQNGDREIVELIFTRRLTFDDDEEPCSKEVCADLDVPMGDISMLRNELDLLDVADDSMISFISCPLTGSSGNSPSELARLQEHEESGLHDVNISLNWSPSPEKKITYGDWKALIAQTPAPPNREATRRRLTMGDIPRSPIKDHAFRGRTSTFAARSEIHNGIPEEQCNFNPFSDDSISSGERSDDGRKRPYADTVTPDIAEGDRGSLSESGYGSRHKVFKGEKVNFRVGSPEFDTGVGRYDADFLVLETIGSGHFGTVSKVRKRLDGAIYAIKRIQDQVKQASFSDVVTEVFALAALDSHPNVLRYFSSWIENGHLYIQSEYCDGGTLRSRIACYEKLTKRFDENEIRHITKQAGAGLSFLHDRMLVHLDVKPDNILISHRRHSNSSSKDHLNHLSDEDYSRHIYKIGDLGHVRSFRNGPVKNCVDGDKRYLAPEILRDLDATLTDAPKADVYSFGISLHETARVGRVTCGSNDWIGTAQRNGMIIGIPHLSLVLNQLVQRMTAFDPASRPTMFQVWSDPAVHTDFKTCSELKMELEVAHMENVALTKELATQCRARSAVNAVNSIKGKTHLIGRGMKSRSVSTQF